MTDERIINLHREERENYVLSVITSIILDISQKLKKIMELDPIRCKDCKYWMYLDTCESYLLVGKCICENLYASPEAFCSNAVRRDE